MNAVSALRAARAAKVEVKADGECLRLVAATTPPANIVDDLRRHKQELLALLAPAGPDGWSALDWHDFFEERAAIAEYDGGMNRQEAEASAYECCVVEYLNQTHTASVPGLCLQCGEAEHSQTPVLPFGTDATGHTWLHSHCQFEWHEQRLTAAKVLLAGMGITPLQSDAEEHLS
jgi:hypothetical protein